MVDRKSASSPNASCRGARAIAATVAAQLALVTTPPVQPRARCESSSARCDALTSGITSGTSDSIRKFFALLSTKRPSRAKAGSSSAAAVASSAENTTGDRTVAGSQSVTVMPATLAGMTPSIQRVTSP